MRGTKVTRKQKKMASADAKRIEKDSRELAKDVKSNRFLAVRANSRDIDQSLQSLDKQMDALDRAKGQVRNNREVQGILTTQKGILKAQKSNLLSLKRSRHTEAKSKRVQDATKQLENQKPKLSIGHMLGFKGKGKNGKNH